MVLLIIQTIQYRFIYEKQDSDGEKSDQELVVDVANDTDSTPMNGKGGSPRENGNGLESNGNSNNLGEKGIKKEPGTCHSPALLLAVRLDRVLFHLTHSFRSPPNPPPKKRFAKRNKIKHPNTQQ